MSKSEFSAGRLRPVVLFDLDGTLVDTTSTIVTAFQQMIGLLQLPLPAHMQTSDYLRRYVGPPLLEAMMDLNPGAALAIWEQMIEIQRDFYIPIASTAPVFDGIQDLLFNLSKKNIRLAVATSKPLEIARNILNARKLSVYFEVIVGSKDDKKSGKAQIVKEAIAELNAREEVMIERIVMVGDRKYDIIGARQNNIPSFFVTWAGTAELDEAVGSYGKFSTPQALGSALERYFFD